MSELGPVEKEVTNSLVAHLGTISLGLLDFPTCIVGEDILAGSSTQVGENIEMAMCTSHLRNTVKVIVHCRLISLELLALLIASF